MSDTTDKATTQLLASIKKSQAKDKAQADNTQIINPAKQPGTNASAKKASSKDVKSNKSQLVQVFEFRSNYRGRLRWPD